MPNDHSSAAAVGTVRPPHHTTPSTGRERRVSEQLVTDWEEERRRLESALALMALDTSALRGPKWAYRFIIAVNSVVESSSMLFYGPGFASLFGLPEKPDQSVPIAAQLPPPYVPVFTRGCIASSLSSLPVRMQGALEREDGRQELYRAALVRASAYAGQHQHLAVGAFNCRVAELRT